MKVAVLLFSMAWVCLAQTAPPPDCQVAANVALSTGNGSVPVSPPALTSYYDNRGNDCVLWAVSYRADAGLSGYTVVFQSAPGSIVPSTFVSFAGNTVAASSSFGTASSGSALYSSVSSSGTTVDISFIRVHSSGASGSGNLHVTIQGWRTNWLSATGGGSSSGCSSPCVVIGPDAPGAAPTKDPVQLSGFDGTDVQRIKTDTSGNLTNVELGTGTFNALQQAVTASAVALPSNAAHEVCVWASVENTADFYVGNSSVTATGATTGGEIPPGMGNCWKLNNSNLIYVIAAGTGQVANFSVR